MRRIDDVECNDDDDEEEEEEEAEVELVVCCEECARRIQGKHSWRREDFFRLVDRRSQSIYRDRLKGGS